MSSRYPAVASLPVHLHNQQAVLFEDAEVAAQRAPPVTPLMGWFAWNREHPDHHYLYPDMPRWV